MDPGAGESLPASHHARTWAQPVNRRQTAPGRFPPAMEPFAWPLLVFLLAFAPVAVAIAHFISFEVRNLIEAPRGLGLLATSGLWTVIAVFRMEAVVYMTLETFMAVKPRTGANEDSTRKPLRAVIAVGSTIIGSGVIVPIGTLGRDSNLDSNLSRRFWNSCQHKASRDSR